MSFLVRKLSNAMDLPKSATKFIRREASSSPIRDEACSRQPGGAQTPRARGGARPPGRGPRIWQVLSSHCSRPRCGDISGELRGTDLCVLGKCSYCLFNPKQNLFSGESVIKNVVVGLERTSHSRLTPAAGLGCQHSLCISTWKASQPRRRQSPAVPRCLGTARVQNACSGPAPVQRVCHVPGAKYGPRAPWVSSRPSTVSGVW